MRNAFAANAGVLAIVLTAAIVAVSVPARADWHSETIDTVGIGSNRCSLAIDADGNPRVAYFNVTTADLKYGTRVGGAWQIEVVPPPPYASSWMFPSLALDSQGRPHIAHFTDPPGLGGYLVYTHWTGSAWQSSNVTYTNPAASLALTAAGEPRIAFRGHTDNGDTLYYAIPSGSSWSIQHVYGSGYGCCGGYPALALDSSDNPRIGYAYYEEFGYLWSEAGAWPSEWLGTKVYNDTASLVLDSADDPHIVYADYWGNLIYGHRTAAGWSFETIVSGGSSACAGLALDPYDHVYVVFITLPGGPNPQILKCAHKTTSSWCIQTVDDTAYCSWPSIATDPSGNPHITYNGASNTVLRYARWGPAIISGDLNCDGCVNFGDINPFVLALTNAAKYAATFPYCDIMNADINADGRVDFGDINPFVWLLTH